MFLRLLPWLLLFAAVMFVLSFPLGRWMKTLNGGKRHTKLLIVGMISSVCTWATSARAEDFSSWPCLGSAAYMTCTR